MPVPVSHGQAMESGRNLGLLLTVGIRHLRYTRASDLRRRTCLTEPVGIRKRSLYRRFSEPALAGSPRGFPSGGFNALMVSDRITR